MGLQNTLISLWGWLLGCCKQWDVLNVMKCVTLSSTRKADLRVYRGAVSNAALYSLRFGFSLKTCKASNLGMPLIIRFLNNHVIYCFEACENFIHYANISTDRKKTNQTTKKQTQKPHSFFSLVGFYLNIKYSCKEIINFASAWTREW